MSYLDVPRIHFGGLFFTNPDTINNYIRSYNTNVPLANAQGEYLSNGPGGSPSGWNATGVAQLWLAECSVLSAVDASGTLLSDPSSDPVIGAAVESPSPATPKKTPDGQGFYDIAKMVDLDPSQQGRSAVYGLRIYVTLPGGAGFSGLVSSVPELQYLNGRVPVRAGSWAAVGTWMGQITEVEWSGDFSSSAFLTEFQAACGQGVEVKLTVDLHQNNNATRLTPGNMFCYGRVLGSLGPVRSGELAQVVPGRLLAQAPASTSSSGARGFAAAAPATSTAPRQFTPQTIDDRFRQAASARAASPGFAATAAAPLPWNPAFAQVGQVGSGSMLHMDLGGSIQLQGSLQNGVGVSNGMFVVDTGITVGVLTASGTVQPLRHGQVSFEDQYQPLDSQNKQVNLVKSSGLVDIPLDPDEASLVAGRPLVVSIGTTRMLQEPSNGLLLGSNPFSVRLEPGGTAMVQLMARQFGQPVVGQEPVTAEVYLGNQPSDEVTVAWAGPTDADGIATLILSTPGGDVTLPPARQPLDSQLYYVYLLDASGQPIGDGDPTVSVLRFQSYTAPAEPTWEQDVGPILQAYARLYPGMKDKLDIGDPATVKGFAPALYSRMSLPVQDPAYMPVTRDLSPAKMAMILQWLKAQETRP